MSYTIADYTFTSTTNTLPAFNNGYVYDYTDTVDTANGTTRRVIVADEYPSSISFNGCGELLTIESVAITNKITSMDESFNECRKLSYIKNTTNWNTSNVTNMNTLFRNCTSLTTLDVSNWDTSNVTDMYYIFWNCNKLTTLDVSNFDTSKVTNIGGMFYNCKLLTTLDVSNFDTSKVTNMYAMFNGCTSLTSLDISNWDTSKVTNMYAMFKDCASLTSLDISNFNMKNVTNQNNMFYNCPNLNCVYGKNISNDTLQKISDVLPENGIFFIDTMDGKDFTTLESKGWQVKTIGGDILVADYTFTSTTDTLPAFNNGYVYDYTDIVDETAGTTRRVITSEEYPSSISFNGCGELLKVNELAITDKVTSMNSCFNECKKLSYINTTNWNTSNIVNISYIFYKCTSLTSLDVSKWDTSNVTTFERMFIGAGKLTEVKGLENFNTGKVTNMYSMFNGCTSLTTLDVSNFNTSNVTNMGYLFSNCNKLPALNLSKWNTGKVTDMRCMFYNCQSLTSLYASKWNTSKVTDMYYIFWNCNRLTILDLSKWDTSNVINTSGMFNSCASLTSLDVSNWNISNVTNMSGMFNSCSKLKDIGMLYSNASTVNKVLSVLPTNNTKDINVWVEDVKASECTIPEGSNIIVKDYIEYEKDITLSLKKASDDIYDKIEKRTDGYYLVQNCEQGTELPTGYTGEYITDGTNYVYKITTPIETKLNDNLVLTCFENGYFQCSNTISPKITLKYSCSK